MLSVTKTDEITDEFRPGNRHNQLDEKYSAAKKNFISTLFSSIVPCCKSVGKWRTLKRIDFFYLMYSRVQNIRHMKNILTK